MRTNGGRGIDLEPLIAEAPQFYRQLLDSMTEGVCVSTEDGVIIYTNPAEDRMFGYEPGGLLGRHVTDLNALPDHENAQVVSAVMAELKSTGMWVGEWRNKRKDGASFFTRARITGLDIGGARHWLCVHEDITEQRRIADELERRRRDLEDFFENSVVGLHWVGSDGTILYANKAELELLGYSREEYIGRHIAEFHADQDAICDILSRLRRGEALDQYPARLKAKDGSTKQVLISSNAQFQDGRFIHTRCFTLDVSARLAAEAARKESDERLDLAVRARGIGVFDWHIPSGRVVWSEQEERLFGLDPGTFEGDISGWTKRVVPEDRERIQCEIGEAMERHQRDIDFHFGIAWPGGEVRYLEGSARFLYADDGTPLRMVGVNIDVTERTRAEEQRELLINELNHRVKNTLATVQSIAAHSLRDGASERARQAFEGRLMALSKAQDVLTRENWEGADIREIADIVIGPYCSARDGAFLIDGPHLRLPPRIALSLSMALHELCTNAAKFGALSVDSGRVTVNWIAAEGRLRLRWEEQHGPPVHKPSRRGFGSRLIERGMAQELGAYVRLAFEPMGVTCTIEVPFDQAFVHASEILGAGERSRPRRDGLSPLARG